MKRLNQRGAPARAFLLALLGALAALGDAAAAHASTGGDYREAIEKARALILEKKRGPACETLNRALSREAKGSAGYRELARSLEELSQVFISEQGQASWSLAESLADSKPREAVEAYQAALKAEEGNVAALEGLARSFLILADCDRASAAIKQAEAEAPILAEIRLLRMQAADCSKNYELLDSLLASREIDLEPVEKRMKSLQAKELFRKKDLKKGRSLLAQWEQTSPDDPEIHYWKWRFSELAAQSDRPAAIRYVQACQNLSQRKRKLFRLDVDLCKEKEHVEAFLRSAGLQPSTLSDQPPSGGSAPQ